MTSLTARLPSGWTDRVDPAWLTGWQPRPFALPGGATEVIVVGTGPPLLLLPGLPGFKETWIAVAARFARHFQVVTYDQRMRRGAPSWAAQLDDLERVADAFAPGPAVVVGHSLGGALAQHWALARPERVSALVLSSSFAAIGGHSPLHWRKRYVEQVGVLLSQRFLPESLAAPLAREYARRGAWVYDRYCDDRVLAFIRFCIRRLSIPLARAALQLAYAHDLRSRIDRLAPPTLLLMGENESRWANEAAAELHRRIPGASLRVSPEAAHLHPISAPEWFCQAIETWLAAPVLSAAKEG